MGDPFLEDLSRPPPATSLAEAEAGAALVATAARLGQWLLVAAGAPLAGRDTSGSGDFWLGLG